MNATSVDHDKDCPRPGFRFGATIRSTKATRAAGTAGKVVMLCKNPRCRGARIV